MDRKAALATAAGLVLVVAGAASALAAAWASPAQEAIEENSTTANVVTEYVDEAGNPVAPPGTVVEGETVIMTRSPAPEEIVVYEESGVVYVDSPSLGASAGTTPTIGGHEDEHEDEDEHGDEDEDEHEDEHGDEDESHDD